jgi:hypothetical protein
VKVTYTIPNGRLAFEMDCSNGKAAFELVARVQELFEESDCGCCKSKNLRFTVREHDGNKYYNLRCADCSAQLDFGQRKDGTGMWMKRTDKDNRPLPNRGWYVYSGTTRAATSQPTNPADRFEEPAPARYESEIPF